MCWVDDDCDGQVDEGNGLCEGDTVCRCGGCAIPCFMGECEGGSQCVDGICEVDQCPEGLFCDNSACVPGTAPTPDLPIDSLPIDSLPEGDAANGSQVGNSCRTQRTEGVPVLLLLLSIFFISGRREAVNKS